MYSLAITSVIYTRLIVVHIQMLLIERKLEARHIDHHCRVFIAGKN